jgi:hypothetical protein
MATWMRVRNPVLGLFAAAMVSACGGRETPDANAYRPVASVDEVMDAIIIPASETVFDAVVYENGALVQSPKTDDDWFRVRMGALAVAEAGNLLMMPGRAEDTEEWVTFSRAMVDSAETVARAAESHDVDRVLQTGGEMYRACAGCHQKYLPKE